MFQTQQNPGRGAPLGANRLQNGKMGENTPSVVVGHIADCCLCRWRISMGIRSPHGRARLAKHANTNKRRSHVKLCASNGRLAASYAVES